MARTVSACACPPRRRCRTAHGCGPSRPRSSTVWCGCGSARPAPPTCAARHGCRGCTTSEWSTLGEEWTTEAGYLLLHENFADITHVAVVDPVIAPPVLSAGPVPLLEVEVSETSVSFSREYPPAPLAPWHAALLGVDPDTAFPQREEGRFVSPALWVDSWDVVPAEPQARPWTFRFTHAVTPVDEAATRHVWRVSRNFAPGDEVSANLQPLFTDYYRRVRQILETMQHVLCDYGPRHDVNVAADAAALQVRKIVGRMVAEESSGLSRRTRRGTRGT